MPTNDLGAALRAAAAGGELRPLQALLSEDAAVGGSAVNSTDEAGCTALIYAAGSGHAEVVTALLAARADAAAATRKGQTALALAEQWGHAEASKVLRGGVSS
mmetsp:Transcript_42194/g.97697  ORF Transcript_42194/g.97697 Transcript_42194/m.97697 type:complete len:103 (-) Transcript_42194:98-406(-)|eukprot:CAMPEP_0171106598 /NCGR_PEP_ID=MMETSP0766_2-20121228/65094_1 /TAXON_ID=439317 /ORGANISM="Gambierdiscus australes, Strain CAWD 149" /LENGTH=102 /DNA_ID=CAMNT_0011567717 /DNA_START=45 /DNA_END=353 /DNA_ORIENTATION=+